MSDGEQKLVDASGDYLYVVRDGQPVENPTWRSCRIVLNDERRRWLARQGGSR